MTIVLCKIPVGLITARITRRVYCSSTNVAMVKQLIKSHKIVIFSKSDCSFSQLAKDMFDKLSEEYKAVELDRRHDGDEILDILGDITGAKTVPRVFIKGKCYGGGEDIEALYDDGKLQKLVS